MNQLINEIIHSWMISLINFVMNEWVQTDANFKGK